MRPIQALAFLLILTTVLLGAAAKRDQYPSTSHATPYLSKSVKMSDSRVQKSAIVIAVQDVPEAQAEPVFVSPVAPAIEPGQAPVESIAIELRSPPLRS